MRTYRASSFISRIVPSVYWTIGIVIVISIVFFYVIAKCNHAGGIKKAGKYGKIMLFLGGFIILFSIAALRDAGKYTIGTKKAEAEVTYVYIDIPTDGASTYLYTVEFPYEEEIVSVKMNAGHKLSVEQGDTFFVYFYPEEIGRTEYPMVVAVDIEKKMSMDNIKVGFSACVIGVLLLVIVFGKQALLDKGLRINAMIIRIESKKSDSERIEKTFICQGINPSTGMLQTFKTNGSGCDFFEYKNGDTVYVFVHKKYRGFYLINI